MRISQLIELFPVDKLGARPNGAGGWLSHGMWALGLHIGGGTANIQRNIIAERGLRLPKEPPVRSS